MSSSVVQDILHLIFRSTNESGSPYCAMLPKPLQYPIPGPGPFRERDQSFKFWMASPSYRGRVISPDLVPFSKDVLSPTEGVVSAQSAVELERLGRASRVRSHGRAPGWETVKVLTSQYLRSHSPGLCPGRDWNPGSSKDPTARAVGFNHCPGRSGQNLVDISCLFYPVPWCKIFSI